MAAQDRNPTHAVDLTFLQDPVGLSFFNAVRRVECAASRMPRIGQSTRSAQDAIQFCQEPSLGFSTSTLKRFEKPEKAAKPRLMVNFLGLLGPQGPMPLHITEYVHNRELNHDDPTLARFFDLFNHRMICLFYRAWAVNRQTVSYDRRQDDRFSAYIGSLIGIGRPAFTDRDAVPDVAKLHYSGHLASQTRHAEGLRNILENYFGVATSIREFVGQWIDIPDAYQCRLGASPDNATIGSNAVVGSRIWDCQHKIRIIMGPMELASYERLLPGSVSFSQLKAWLRNYIGDEISWELQLVLKAPEVPTVRLGEEGRLGRTAWIKSQPFEADVKDMIIQSDAA